MDDKLKIFWNLEVLVKMSRSKNDGPSLRIEELEIENKIKNYRQEIEEIESVSEEENYDTSAEMADRNIEIITKKQIQVLKQELKDKNRELTDLKNEEKALYEKTNLLRENKASQEQYIESMQERVNEIVGVEILDRYNGLIAETTEKVNQLRDELEQESSSYKQVQEQIIEVTEKISILEEAIAKKKVLLSETQAHLENKDNYIDHTKTEKNTKKIADLENKIQKLNSRLEVIRQDTQYLETKIKDIVNNKESNEQTKPYLVDLINQVIRVPYINVPTDNLLEEELLRATQARDSFANEIDQKTYNILEADTPEKLRIEFLTARIAKWKEQLEHYNARIAEIDHDEQFNYERKERILSVMINSMKNDVKEFERAYEDVPDTNIGAKASIKAALEEKKEDLIEAEKIATLFRKDEAEDIANATRTIKYECEQINKNIAQANDEIQRITNRLTSKKSGLIDISTRNKDKDILKELAQIVINIKHRRQFPETPNEIIERLEEDLGIDIRNSIDMYIIDETSTLIPKDYEEYYTKNSYYIDEEPTPTNEIDLDVPPLEEEKENNSSIDNFQETYNRLIMGEEEQEKEESPVEPIEWNPIDESFEETEDEEAPEEDKEENSDEITEFGEFDEIPEGYEIVYEEVPIDDDQEIYYEEQEETEDEMISQKIDDFYQENTESEEIEEVEETTEEDKEIEQPEDIEDKENFESEEQTDSKNNEESNEETIEESTDDTENQEIEINIEEEPTSEDKDEIEEEIESSEIQEEQPEEKEEYEDTFEKPEEDFTETNPEDLIEYYPPMDQPTEEVAEDIEEPTEINEEPVEDIPTEESTEEISPEPIDIEQTDLEEALTIEPEEIVEQPSIDIETQPEEIISEEPSIEFENIEPELTPEEPIIELEPTPTEEVVEQPQELVETAIIEEPVVYEENIPSSEVLEPEQLFEEPIVTDTPISTNEIITSEEPIMTQPEEFNPIEQPIVENIEPIENIEPNNEFIDMNNIVVPEEQPVPEEIIELTPEPVNFNLDNTIVANPSDLNQFESYTQDTSLVENNNFIENNTSIEAPINDNIYSNEQIENELDNYINDLENRDS